MPVGTTISLSVRNELGAALTVHGFGAAPLIVPPGQVRATRFLAANPGAFFYWGTITGLELDKRFAEDAQLNGALVVDPPGALRLEASIFGAIRADTDVQLK